MSKLVNYLLVFTIPILITACSSSLAVPPVPEFTGNCHTDLYNVLQYYVVPVERQK